MRDDQLQQGYGIPGPRPFNLCGDAQERCPLARR